MPIPRPAASMVLALVGSEQAVTISGVMKREHEVADDHGRDAGEHLDDRLDDAPHAGGAYSDR